MGSYLYTSTWIAKKVIRLQTEGEGRERVVTYIHLPGL